MAEDSRMKMNHPKLENNKSTGAIREVRVVHSSQSAGKLRTWRRGNGSKVKRVEIQR